MTQDQMSHSSRIPSRGAPVFSRDGAALGEVKEVADGFFKVDAPRAADYWLSCEFVLTNTDAGVELDFDEIVLDDYKLDAPAPTMTGSPALDEATDTFDDPAEKALRRERMESGYGDSGGDLGTRR